MKELTSEELIEWKRIITDVLRVFHEICKENNLRYFCFGGTAIGALRHKGFIPWDDDIDVEMPRPDYDRFIELFRGRVVNGCKLYLPEETPNYPVPFMKFCKAESTLVEEPQIPCVTGLFIDIFPLDATDDDEAKAKAIGRKYKKIWNRLEAISNRSSFTEYISLLMDRKEWGRFVTKTCGFFFRERMRRVFLSRLNEISHRYDFDKAKNFMVYSGAHAIMPRRFAFSEVKEMPFEDIMVYMSTEHDIYLNAVFGDYMQLPPEEQRVSHHFHHYVNMHKRIPADVVLKEI